MAVLKYSRQREAIKLELDEVQHGIAAVSDESVIRFLADNKIRLNITPTSNILLGRVADMFPRPRAGRPPAARRCSR